MAMKAVIDGVRYDTMRAIAVARVSGGADTHCHYRGQLYVTPRSRRWFLVGDGGPLSMFGQTVGNVSTSGSGLVPLSPERVREILERGDDECQRALDAYAEELAVVDADSLPVAV
jgi:hypothetical protein